MGFLINIEKLNVETIIDFKNSKKFLSYVNLLLLQKKNDNITCNFFS